MNIFYLSEDPVDCALAHCDKHVVKMILEYGQLLSTAHRLHDGTPTVVEWTDLRYNGKGALTERHHKRTVHLLPGEQVELVPGVTYLGEIGAGRPLEQRTALGISNSKIYLASHVNHPDSLWARENTAQYLWLYHLFYNLLQEYSRRYGKVHAADRLRSTLRCCPRNMEVGAFKDPPLCMPDEYKGDDAVTSYQNLYVGSKARFAKWTNRRPPSWFISRTPNYDPANFERTR